MKPLLLGTLMLVLVTIIFLLILEHIRFAKYYYKIKDANNRILATKKFMWINVIVYLLLVITINKSIMITNILLLIQVLFTAFSLYTYVKIFHSRDRIIR